MSVHPTAIVDANARLGVDVSIGPYAVIGPDTVIGDRCKIWPHAVIEFTTLGSECEVYPGATLGLAPQHLRYRNEPSRLEVGMRTTFRESVTAHRGSPFDESITRIGNDCFFMFGSHIAHDCRVGNNVILANGAQLAGHVQVGDNSFVSSMAGIHQFVRIGSGAIVSGGAMVPLDVAPFTISQGDRAKLRGLNAVGMRRMGLSRESIRRIREAYRVVFRSGLPLAEALADPALAGDDPAVRTFRDFLTASKRGFLRPPSDTEAVETEEVDS